MNFHPAKGVYVRVDGAAQKQHQDPHYHRTRPKRRPFSNIYLGIRTLSNRSFIFHYFSTLEKVFIAWVDIRAWWWVWLAARYLCVGMTVTVVIAAWVGMMLNDDAYFQWAASTMEYRSWPPFFSIFTFPFPHTFCILPSLGIRFTIVSFDLLFFHVTGLLFTYLHSNGSTTAQSSWQKF